MQSVMMLSLLAILVVPTTAFGQQVIRQADKTVYKQKTVIDFSDVTIQGELTKPEGSYLLNRKKTKFKTLLKIRANFLPELFNSTDNL
ncbi:MAG: hypothetical protein AAFV29_18135 [Myxococcota bacterium]